MTKKYEIDLLLKICYKYYYYFINCIMTTKITSPSYSTRPDPTYSDRAIQSALDALYRTTPAPQSLPQEATCELIQGEKEALTTAFFTTQSTLPLAHLPLSLSELSLIHGDAIRSQSQLDRGGTILANAQLLKTLLDSLSGLDLTPIKQKLNQIMHWGMTTDSLSTIQELQPRAVAICKAIATLAINQSVTFPGGYTNQSGGHALIYEITKTGDNLFEFHIINTGDGVQFHPQSLQGLKNKAYPLFTISNITLKELVGHDYYHPQIDLILTLLAFNKVTNKPFTHVSQIYSAVTDHFQGKKTSQKNLVTDTLITPQRSGTCTWKCLMALMRHTLTKQEYKQVVFFIKQHTLVLFFQKNKELLTQDSIQGRQARNFLKLITQKLSLTGTKTLLQTPPKQTPDQIKTSLAIAETILSELYQFQKAIYLSKPSLTYNLNDITPTPEALPNVPWHPLIDLPEEPIIHLPLIPAFDFSTRSFSQNLSLSHNFFATYATNPRLQRELILSFVKATPSILNKDYYAQIPLGEIPEILLGLFKHLKAYATLGVQNEFCITNDKITLLSLHALCLELSLNYEEKKTIDSEDRLSTLFGINFDTELSLENNIIHLPSDIKRWEELSTYFKPFKDEIIIHQTSYKITEKNPKPDKKTDRLAYLFYQLTQRHLYALRAHPTQDQGAAAPLEFTARLIVDNTPPTFQQFPPYPQRPTIFDAIGLPHLQILKTSSFIIQHFLQKNKAGLLTLAAWFYTYGPSKQNSREFYYLIENRSQNLLHIYWDWYGRLSSFGEPPTSMRNTRMKKIGVLSSFSGQASLDEAQRIQYAKRTNGLVPGAEVLFQAANSYIDHPLIHDTLRPIELLSFAYAHLESFKDSTLRVHFLSQLFKLICGEDQLFELIEDDKFHKAFTDLLLNAHRYGAQEDNVSFSIFSFIMTLGVLLLPHIKQDFFQRAIELHLAPIHEQLKISKNQKHLHTLHLLIGLKEAFLIQSALSHITVAQSAGAAGSKQDFLSKDLQPHLETMLISWMIIKTNEQDAGEFNHIARMLDDHVYELLTHNTLLYPLINNPQLLKTILKKTLDLELPDATWTVSPENPCVFTSNDPDCLCIDLYTGSISNSKGPLTLGIYDRVYNNPVFQTIFGKRKDFTFTFNNSWFLFKDPLLGSFRVTTEFLLHKQIQGSWSMSICYHNYPEDVIDRFRSQTSPCAILKDYIPYKNENGYYYFLKYDDTVKPQHAYFIPSAATDLTLHKIDPLSYELLAQIIPVPFLPHDIQSLVSRFEEPSFVYLEQTPTTTKLVFSRYKSHTKSDQPLSFVRSGTDWLLESNPTKKLAATAPSTLMGDFKTFLTLETLTTGQRSALIPSLEYLKPETLPSFTGGHNLNIDRTAEGMQTLSRSYDEIPFEGDELNPSTIKHKLRAFYLQLSEKDPDKALSYLKQISSSDIHIENHQNLVEVCLKLLENIEQTPQVVALQMQLIYLISHYQFIKGTDSTPILKTATQVYQRYLELLAHIPFHFRLNFEQESLILQMLIKVAAGSQQAKQSNLLPDFAQERIASCPQLIPQDQCLFYPPNLATHALALPITKRSDAHLSSKTLLSYVSNFFEETLEKVEVFQRECHRALNFLSLNTLLELLEKNHYIYDLIYQVRKLKDPSKKLHLHQLLNLAYHLNYNQEDKEQYCHKLILMLNHEASPESDPAPLCDHLRFKFKQFRATNSHYPTTTDFSGWICDWSQSISEAFESSADSPLLAPTQFRTTSLTLQQPIVSSAPSPDHHSLYPPHLRVLTPTTGEVLLSWTDSIPKLTPLKALESLSSEMIPFIYGHPPIEASSMQQLKAVITRQANPALASAINQEFEDFIQGWAQIPQSQRSIPAINQEQLIAVNTTISQSIDHTKTHLEHLLKTIFSLAHAQNTNPLQAQIDSGLRVAGLSKKLSLEHLLFLLTSSNLASFQNACPHLSPPDIQTLYNHLSLYLYLSIYLTQMIRFQKTATSLQNTLSDKAIHSVSEALRSDGTMIYPQVVSKALELKLIAEQTLEGQPTAQNLVFQYTSQLMFRKDPAQEMLIQQLSESSHKVAQVIMGGGKTTVIAANLLAKACSSGKIAIMITPTFQYQSLYKTMQATLKTIFDIEVVTFNYKKEELTLECLTNLEHTLCIIKNSAVNQAPKVLLLCPETLQLLSLEYLETIQELSSSHSTDHALKLNQKRATLKRILKLLKTQGYALGDEVHILLDIVKEIYIPVGDLHTVDQENIALIGDIFKIIYNQPITLSSAEKQLLESYLLPDAQTSLLFTSVGEDQFSFKIDQILKLTQNKQSYFSKTCYQQILLPKLAKILANHPSLMLYDDDQKEGFTHYTQGTMKGTLQRALDQSTLPDFDNRTDLKNLQFLHQIRKLHTCQSPKEKKAADLIALSKYILSDLLPTLLSKTGNVHFGRAKDPQTPGKVVPYICADTPSPHEFGNHYEAIVYHFMSAIMFGVEDNQIYNLFNSWHEQSCKLSKAHLPYEKTPSAVLCKQIFGILPRQIKTYFTQIKASLALGEVDALNKLFVIERHTIDQYVRYQQEKLNAHALMLVDQFKEFIALSGTPDIYTLSTKLQTEPLLDNQVNPLCIRAFLEKPSKIFISTCTDSAQTFIDESFAKLNVAEKGDICALLDAGGVFKDYDNQHIAQTLLTKLSAEGRVDLKGIIFFTRLNGSTTADYPVLMKVGGSELTPLNGTSIQELSSKGLNVGDYAVYLDSRHCTGIDIKLPQNALGFLTYDPSMGLDDTTQAMMRFRDYLVNQSLIVLVPNYSCASFPKTGTLLSELTTTDPLEAKKLIVAQMITKQVDQRSHKMIKSFKKMLENTLFQKALELLETMPNQSYIKKIAQGFKSSLASATQDAPYLSFGSLLEEVDTLDSLEKKSQELVKQLKQDLIEAKFPQECGDTASFDDNLVIEDILEAVKRDHNAILKQARAIKERFISRVMDPIVGQTSTTGTEKQVHALSQVQTTVEVHQEIEQEIEVELKKFERTGLHTPKKLTSFNPQALIDQLCSNLPIQGTPLEGTIVPLAHLFQNLLAGYAPLFSRSPLLMTSHFKQPFNEDTYLFNSKHLMARPFQHLLVCQTSDSSYQAIIVSECESSELATYLRANPQIQTAWLTEPTGHLQGGHQATWEVCSKNELIKSFMLTFNLLGGNASYLVDHLDDYAKWYFYKEEPLTTTGVAEGGVAQNGVALDTVKLKFLKLIAATHPLAKDLMLAHLIDKEALSSLIDSSQHLANYQAFDDVSELVLDEENVQKLSYVQLRALTSSQVESIKQWLTRKQIPYLSEKTAQKLGDDQLQYLEPRQVKGFCTQDQSMRLPACLIQKLKAKDLEGTRILDNLTQIQYGALTDPELIGQVEEIKVSYIDPRMTPHVGSNFAKLKHLSPQHFSYLSREQLELLKSHTTPASNPFHRIPLEAISTLPLTTLTETSAPLVQYLNLEQKNRLSAEQIGLIQRVVDLQHLPHSLWQHANETLLQKLDLRAVPIETLSPTFVNKISLDQYQALTQAQVQSLLSEEQASKFDLLSEDQLKWLLPSQIRYVKTKEDLRHIEPSLWAHASDAVIASLDRSELRLITPENFSMALLKKLSIRQLLDINPSIIPLIPLDELSEQFLTRLPTSFGRALTNDQIGAIPTKDLFLKLVKNTSQWAFGHRSIIQQLTEENLQTCSLQEMANVNFLGKLTPDQLKLLTQDQVQAITEPAIFRQCKKEFLTQEQQKQLDKFIKTQIKTYSWIKFFTMHPSQLKYCSWVQTVAFTVGQLAQTLFYGVLAIPLKPLKLMTRACPITIINQWDKQMTTTFKMFQALLLKEPMPD